MKFIILSAVLFFSSASFAQQHINQAALDSLSDACLASHSDSFSVWVDGKAILDYHNIDTALPCYSVFKSITSLAAGKLITDGKLPGIDEPVMKYFPEWNQGLKRLITIRHLMNHTSGLDFNESDSVEWTTKNQYQFSLCANVVDTPGTQFLYNTKATTLLAAVLEKAAGMKFDRYIERNIFRPLGITNFKWEYDDARNLIGISSTSSELIKIGRLVLDKGKWNGKQLIAENWIREIAKPSQKFDQHDGLLWWLIPENTQYIVDDTLIDAMKKYEVKPEIVAKFEMLKGTYINVNIPPEKLAAVFGANWQDYLNKEFYPSFPVRSRRKYSEKIIGIKAEGWLGQSIVVIPEKRLVAARMIRYSDRYVQGTDELLDFADRVNKVVN